MDWIKSIKFEKSKGEIIASGNRIVLVTAGALKALRETTKEVMKEETADSIIYLAGKRHTKKMIADVIADSEFTGFINKFKWGKSQITSKVVDILSQYGYGTTKILSMDFPKSAEIILTNSCIANEYKTKQEKTVCSYIAGLLAGGAEAIYGTAYDCFETECVAKGDKACKFVIEKT